MEKAITILLILVIFCSAVWADLGDELLQAAKDGDLAEVEKLLELGVGVDFQGSIGRTALMEASYSGYTEIVELLIDAGADVNIQNSYSHGSTALLWASMYDRLPIVELLIEAVEPFPLDFTLKTY